MSTEKVAEIAAVIRENAEAYDRREIGYERFSDVAYAAWQDAERAGLVEAVRAAVCQR